MTPTRQCHTASPRGIFTTPSLFTRTLGVITVSNVSDFRSFYQLVVKASDGLYKDSATVMVNVTNLTASDLGFQHSVYSASVTENLKTVQTLAALKATGCHLNEPLFYSVLNPMGRFAVSQSSGVLETTGVPFDREQQDVYTVVVKVEDMRTPARTATAQEDYNLFRIDPGLGDVSLQRPVDFEALNKYVLRVLAVDEAEPTHSTAAQLVIQARNPDGYRLIYNLEEGNGSKHFHIDFKTGVLTVTNPLDYESQTMHVLTVRASDSVTGAFSEASIEIEVEDVNDNAPVFSKSKYSVNMAEALPVGSSVIQVSASDRDSAQNKDLTFEIMKTEGNETEFFAVDPSSGMIVTTQVLDHENTKHFILKIKATDRGSAPLSGETSVFVNVTDVNDNPPDFVTSQYGASLDEMAKCGHIVIKIQASDPDTGDLNNLKYKILSGNEGRTSTSTSPRGSSPSPTCARGTWILTTT
ncbi:unnamed protein product [Pleuronectes platessa]|uniref:Cadherin domain-containing protein n=1 Tax=Pleuronectes platessa TaxID=8262 RepID=A0A9N7Y8A6_PLEPL|nr:unnamed protein product [Pleuronectes platessa]